MKNYNVTYYVPGYMVCLYTSRTRYNKYEAMVIIVDELTGCQVSADGVYRWVNRPWGDERANAALDSLRNLKSKIKYKAIDEFKQARGYSRMSSKRREEFNAISYPWIDAVSAAMDIFREKKCTSRGIGVLEGVTPDPLPCSGDKWRAYRDQAGFAWLEITGKVPDAKPGIVCGVSPSGDLVKVQNVPHRFARALAELCNVTSPPAEEWAAWPCKSCLEHTAKNAEANGASDLMSLFALAISIA
jgi:hypothetical protein